MNAVYVYALVQHKARSRPVLGRRIEFVPVGGIFAAIERRVSAPEITEATLREQHQVVSALARFCDPILPVRFGALLERDELERVLALRSDVLRGAFDLVRHKEQMTVRIFGNAQVRDHSSRRRSSGTVYLEDVRNAARPRTTALSDAVRSALSVIAAGERIDTGRGRLQIAMHHLIERGRAEEYRAIVDRAVVQSRASEQVVISGPWPPFAFSPDLWP